MDQVPITQTPRTPGPTSATIAIDLVDCAEVAAFLERTRPARHAAAGLTTAAQPSPTPVPSNAEPPPLGQYVLRESPDAEFNIVAFVGFLQTAQSLGPLATGQTPELAARSALIWGFSRNWTGRGPGGFASTVYEFAGASGARDFEEGAARGACLQGGSLFDVAGIPGAIGQLYDYGYPSYGARVSFLVGKRRYTVQIVSLTAVQPQRIAELARIALVIAK
jgi:hypothetical protein